MTIWQVLQLPGNVGFDQEAHTRGGAHSCSSKTGRGYSQLRLREGVLFAKGKAYFAESSNTDVPQS